MDHYTTYDWEGMNIPLDGKMVGEEIVKAGEEGKIAEVEYKWPRPGSTDAVPKVSITKIGDEVCGVGLHATNLGQLRS